MENIMLVRCRLILIALIISSSLAKSRGEDRAYPSDFPWEDYSIFQWQETRARFGVGADYFYVGSQEDAAPSISLRYRLSPLPWPQSEDRPWHLGPIPL